MGIQGLIPFLDKSSRPINISLFSGCIVAIDAYCWLHKGAFSCADKLARGDKTDGYVTYCMKYVNMLLALNIKPIMVFDGRHLPAKSQTEKKRRENREVNRRRAAELLRQDKPNEARTFLQRCVDVTHSMAVELMRECRSRNVDCITAPYEADSQLAYLNLKNIAHVVVTEDSDLLLFGCTKVIFKLDLSGNGLLVDQENLHLSMGVSKGKFSLDKFRHMCILSGCDYLPSLPKIGLAKACRFVKSTVDPDIHRALSRLGGHLNMNIVVPLEYRDKFMEAQAMFCHQPVYDPLARQLVPLTPLPPGAPPLPLLSQETLTPEQQLQLALGNLDPFSLKLVDNWSPDKIQQSSGRSNSWISKQIVPHKSIWSADFKPKALITNQPDLRSVKHKSTSGKIVERKVEVPAVTPKRPIHSAEEELNTIREQFVSSTHQSKKPRYSNEDLIENLQVLEKSDKTPPKPQTSYTLESPKKNPANPFPKTTPCGNKFSGLSKLAQFRKANVNNTNKVQSRYFDSFSTSVPESETSECNKVQKDSLKDVSNVIERQEKLFDKISVEKLTDNKIETEIFKEEANIINKTNEKENCCNTRLKCENAFNWKPSLEDLYGFASSKALSSTSINKQFVNPIKNEINYEKQTHPENSSLIELKNTPNRKNPFAKTKTVETVLNLATQDSFTSSDILTPDSAFSEDTDNCNSQDSISPISATTPRPQIKVGLSKKQSHSCQKSLLSMFAFQPKPKIEKTKR